MLRKLTLLLIAAVAFSQTTQVAAKQTPKPYEVPEAYEVYAAVLALENARRDPTGELLIADTTVSFDGCQDRHADKMVASVIRDYRQTNKTDWRLQEKFNIPQNYKLLSDKEIKDMMQPDPQGGFFWYFPENIQITHLSAVGFNKDKTIAFVAMDIRCGGQCGGGTSYTLQKVAGKWQEYEKPWITRVVKKEKKDVKDGEWQSYNVILKGFSSTCAWSY
jgi:hypothetical protein